MQRSIRKELISFRFENAEVRGGDYEAETHFDVLRRGITAAGNQGGEMTPLLVQQTFHSATRRQVDAVVTDAGDKVDAAPPDFPCGKIIAE